MQTTSERQGCTDCPCGGALVPCAPCGACAPWQQRDPHAGAPLQLAHCRRLDPDPRPLLPLLRPDPGKQLARLAHWMSTTSTLTQDFPGAVPAHCHLKVSMPPRTTRTKRAIARLAAAYLCEMQQRHDFMQVGSCGQGVHTTTWCSFTESPSGSASLGRLTRRRGSLFLRALRSWSACSASLTMRIVSCTAPLLLAAFL